MTFVPRSGSKTVTSALDPTEKQKNYKDDQDDADDANSSVTVTVPVSTDSATETAE
jgi:hypothetical protein